MITGPQICNAIRELALDYPETVYQRQNTGRCFYTKGDCTNGSVGCIVGQALIVLGVDKSVFGDENDLNVSTKCAEALICDCVKVELTIEQKRWIGRVQGGQDSGKTWGEAARLADLELAQRSLAGL